MAQAAILGLEITIAQTLLVLAIAWHHESPACMCFSGDGHLLAVSCGDRSMAVFDADSGAELLRLPGRTSEPIAAAFNRDGTLLRTVGSDLSLTTWAIPGGERSDFQEGFLGGGRVVAFSEDGARLALAHRDILLVDLDSGQRNLSRNEFPALVRGLAFDDNKLAAITGNPGEAGELTIRDSSTGAVLKTWSCPPGAYGAPLVIDGPAVFMICQGTKIVRWDWETGERTLDDFSKPLTALAKCSRFCNPPAKVAAGDADGSVIHVRASDDERSSFRPHADVVRCLAFRPAPVELASMSADRTVALGCIEKERLLIDLDSRPAWEAKIAEAWLRCNRWDAYWYSDVATRGFRSTIPPESNRDTSNVAFFPGFPLLVRGVWKVSGLPIETAVLLASQLACWAFWTYFLLLLRRWQVPTWQRSVAVIAVLVHPAAFFLVTGYTESLFLLGLLGLVYWSEFPGRGAAVLAALHGMAMTATRLVGLPLVFYPLCLVSGWNDASWRQRLALLARPLFIAAVAALGTLLFFVFCQQQFGHWDLYMQTSKTGWNVAPDYLVFFRWQTYVPPMSPIDADAISRLSIPITTALIGLLLLREWRVRHEVSGTHLRLALCLAAALMLYVSGCGMSGRGMASMIRHSFAIHTLLVLAAVHLLSKVRPSTGGIEPFFAVVLGMFALLALVLQLKFIDQFTSGIWVA